MCFLKKNKIFDAELWAILNALDIATQETLNANNTPMTIFCDLQKALQAIQHPSYKENWFLRRQIYHKAKNLQSTRHLIIYWWTPGHSGLEGSKRADLTAKNRAEKSDKQAERWSSFAYIKENLAQARPRELAKWHEVKTQEREVSCRGFYISLGQKLKSTRYLETPQKNTPYDTTSSRWNTAQWEHTLPE